MAITLTSAAPCGSLVGSVLCFQTPMGGEICLPDTQGALRDILRFIKDSVAPFNAVQPLIKVFQVIADFGILIKDLIGPPPNPAKAAADIGTLIADLGAVAQLANPVASFIFALVGELQAIQLFQTQLYARIQAFVAGFARLQAQLQVAQKLNNATWLRTLICAQNNLNTEAARLFNELGVLASFFRLINSVLCFFGAGPLVPLTVTPNLSDMLAPLQLSIKLVGTVLAVLNKIPGISIPLHSC